MGINPCKIVQQFKIYFSNIFAIICFGFFNMINALWGKNEFVAITFTNLNPKRKLNMNQLFSRINHIFDERHYLIEVFLQTFIYETK